MATKKKAVKKHKAAGDKKPAVRASTGQRADLRRNALLELMGQLNSTEHRVIAYGNEVPNTYELRRPSGLMQLDIDTGGGLPSGGVCCLTGPEGSGKTELMLNYMAMHQKLYGDDSYLAMAAIEGQFDFKRARQVGMKIRVPKRMVDQWREQRHLLGEPDFTKEEIAGFNEQIGEFVLIGGNTGEEVLEAILESHKKKIFGIIGLDSINGLLPAADASKDLDENDKRSARATLMTRFFSRYIPTTTGLDGINETTIIMIQQVRANPDKATAPSYMQAYLKDWASTGAWATKHFKLVDITIWDGQKIKKPINGEKIVVGKELRWDLEKGKAGCHDNVSGSWGFYYDTGINPIGSTVVAGTRYGTFREQLNGEIHILRPNGTPSPLGAAPNFQALEGMMRADPEFEMAVRREVLAAAGITCLYR